MKKKIALLLVLATMVTAFSGCGNEASSDEANVSEIEIVDSDAQTPASVEEEAASNIWSAEGMEFPVPAYWNKIETTTDCNIDEEMANEIIAANDENTSGTGVTTGIADIICKRDVGVCNSMLDTENGLEEIINNIGQPNAAYIDAFFIMLYDSMDEDYKKNVYSYGSEYIYNLNETYNMVIYCDQAIVKNTIDDESYFPEILGIYIYKVGEEPETITNLESTDINDTYAEIFLDKKGSL